MQDFRNLKAWERGRGPAVAFYKVAGDYPDTERYGLTCQMRGAAVSICSNMDYECVPRVERLGGDGPSKS